MKWPSFALFSSQIQQNFQWTCLVIKPETKRNALGFTANVAKVLLPSNLTSSLFHWISATCRTLSRVAPKHITLKNSEALHEDGLSHKVQILTQIGIFPKFGYYWAGILFQTHLYEGLIPWENSPVHLFLSVFLFLFHSFKNQWAI